MRDWQYTYSLNPPTGLASPSIPSDADICELTTLLENKRIDRKSIIPAGFTYFGQFIDHDLTLLRQTEDRPDTYRLPPEQLVPGRRPALDLDSIYGGGLADSVVFYNRGSGKFQLGDTAFRKMADLFRGTSSHNKRAFIGDERNDENLLVAQMQVLFMRLHNRFVDHYDTPGGRKSGEHLFHLARAETINTYQHLVLNNFAGNLIDRKILQKIYTNKKVRLLPSNPDNPQMSIEFAGGAFRLHSLVQPDYTTSEAANGAIVSKSLIQLFEATSKGDPANFPLSESFRIDWTFFFKFSNYPNLKRSHPNSARALTPSLNRSMASIHNGNQAPINMLHRNIRRGLQLGLPSGQAACKWLLDTHSELAADIGLKQIELPTLDALPDSNILKKETPLWVWLMYEAEQQMGFRLGPLGSWLVADTFRAAFEASDSDYAIGKWDLKDSIVLEQLNRKSGSSTKKSPRNSLDIEDVIYYCNYL